MIFQEKKSVNAGPSCGTGEGVAHSKRWYVALVRMHHEKKVSERLSKMGIDSFVPVQQQIHQWSDRRKLVDTVLLPMMVFVHVTPKERMEVLSFSTVSRYMVMRGEKVRVIKGPLSGLVGELVTVGGRSKIAVRLNMLGCACVDMPIGYVEPIHLINDTSKV